AEICRGKRVILVTATPYNNSPKDILSQIKLFQKSRKSTIPNLPDLESFFNRLSKKLKNLDRQKDYNEYIRIVRENAREIREKVLKYLMVRRTRSEIIKYFSKDLKEQKLKFPDIENPIPLFYEFNDEEDNIFNKTIGLISKQIKYCRYSPLLYHKEKISQPEEISQINMGKFMKILLIKRLESSFFAFKNSINRFIHSYEMFISEFEKGNVYVSKKYSNKIFEFLENDDDEAIQKLIDEGKAEKYVSKDFNDDLIRYLKNDHDILKQVKALWEQITRDPKLNCLIKQLRENDILKNNKLIIFTESRETAEYLTKNLHNKINHQVICFSGSSDEIIRDKVIENFDGRARHPKDDFCILVSTEVLSEGVNLHRSNVVINYDIPWNPTRMMQRVGRINRVDTKFEKIYTFNFFPTVQSNDQIKLREAAETKINAFLTLLGNDSALLTEGEPIGSHELFNRLISQKTLVDDDETEESELKYLQIIKNIRDNDPHLFETIKQLPRKARSARAYSKLKGTLLTYFRRGKLQKFFIGSDREQAQELDFLSAAGIFECSIDEKREKLTKKFYALLDKNKEAFILTTSEEIQDHQGKKGRDSSVQILKILKVIIKNTQKFTDDQEMYLKRVMSQLEQGGFPKHTTKEALKALNELNSGLINPLKVLGVLQKMIPIRLLDSHYVEKEFITQHKREVILSLYLKGE
ncbi:MAG: helicase, partial [Spirochaetes bacterium]|nr:helicase [Spirochaetota bacterium]